MDKKLYLTGMLVVMSYAFGHAQQWTFANHFGGTASGYSDAVKAICTDAAGNVYATGNFNSTINFGNGTASLTATTGGTATDGFVAKFDASGLCQWSMRFGGAATDQGGLGIATNGTTVFVTGQSQFPATIGSTALSTVGGSTDGVVFALNASTGATVWATAFGGGSTNDQGQAICLDNSGNVYISGVFSTRTSNPTAYFGASGSFPRTVQGNMAQATSDMFVAQLNPGTGAFNWVSSGGASSSAAPLVIGNDNVTGSGIAYIPTLNKLVAVGSFYGSNASYYSNGSSTAAVTLTNSGASDIDILTLDLSGNFLTGISAGGSSTDEALAVSYDAASDAAYIAGYFTSTSVAGAFNLTNSSPTYDEIYYARYNPGANTVGWAKSASGPINDVAFGVASSGAGQVYVTGRYQGTISFPGVATSLTSTSAGADDIFLLNVDTATGNAYELATGNGSVGTDAGLAVAVSTDHNVWTGGIVAGGTVSFTPSNPAVSVTISVDEDMFIATYNDPPPMITAVPQPVSVCAGLPVSFTVGASGSPLLYQWQSGSDAAFSSPVVLANTGVYAGVNTAVLALSDDSLLNGTYYRALIWNGGGSVLSSGALLTVNAPSLPTGNVTVSETVGGSGGPVYTGSCVLLGKIVPSGASPVSGNVTSEEWVEHSVPSVGSSPFVQRHYQITPAGNASTATATVTLYFTQGDFDAFNAAPGSTLKLPTGPSDVLGISNLRVAKYSGVSGDGTGLPASYSSGAIVIDPDDSKIVWNAGYGYWEVSFDVSGFSGFIVQSDASPLPLTLLDFTAGLSGPAVSVAWKTTDEVDNDHFVVERSTDGASFSPVATVAAAVGAGEHAYAWSDQHVLSLGVSSVYYRLRSVALDGTYVYSHVVSVDLRSLGVIAAVVNPFRGALSLRVDVPGAFTGSVRVSDMSGRLLFVEALSGNGVHVLKGTAGLAAGVYIVSVVSGGEQTTVKVIKEN